MNERDSKYNSNSILKVTLNELLAAKLNDKEKQSKCNKSNNKK